MKRPNKRRSRRVAWNEPGKIISLTGEFMLDCLIIDISAGGARIAVGLEEAVPDYFRLHITAEALSPKCRVRWRRGNELGLEFYRT